MNQEINKKSIKEFVIKNEEIKKGLNALEDIPLPGEQPLTQGGGSKTKKKFFSINKRPKSKTLFSLSKYL